MENEISTLQIEKKIFVIRGVQVMIDRDIAELYGVETKVLNQAVKRNITRFPKEFMFQLTRDEIDNLKSQIVTSRETDSVMSQFVTSPKTNSVMSQIATSPSSRSQIVTLNTGRGSNIKYLPFAFTEQGCAMLSSVLRSETAVQVSIQIMKAFVSMRHFVQSNSQIFNAYAKFESFIQSAQKEIILIDNYVDLTVLQRLAKKKKGVNVIIYTDPKTKLTSQDIQIFNTQYPTITLNHTTKMHDRFMIIDNKLLYHIGASLKDLGKKCFAFEILDASFVSDILKNI